MPDSQFDIETVVLPDSLRVPPPKAPEKEPQESEETDLTKSENAFRKQ